MIGPTARQNELLIFLRAHIRANGFAPSVEEIRQAMGLASKHGAVRLLERLESRKLIARIPKRTRAIEILGPDQNHPADCGCEACLSARYLAQLKLVQGLEVDPPIAVLRAKHENFRPLSAKTRRALLAGKERLGKAASRGAARLKADRR